MSGTTAPIAWTGIGSWPGDDPGEALKAAFDGCPEFPYLPELPERGIAAQLIGRGTALLEGLGVDLQPAGWRLTDASGVDHRRARSLLRQDLDRFEEVAQGYVGPAKLSVAGPWTLAAGVELPRGDRVLGDTGARRDLVQSLTQGVIDLVAELRRRMPEIAWTCQLDEPSLPAVLAGALPRASGFGRHRAIDRPEVSEAYAGLVAAVGVPVAVHSCAPDVPVGLLADAGVHAVALDLDLLRSADWDAVGAALEAGLWLWIGALPTAGLAARPPGPLLGGDEVAARVLRPLRALGLDPAVAAQLVLTPACGLAGAEPRTAAAALRTLRTAAGIITEELPR